jgi:RimJ/RimL family protein N-acetyltransferase
VLTGERVTLRPVRPDDLPTLYAWRLDLDTWGATTASPPYPMTFELFRERAEKAALESDGAEFVVEVGGTVIGRGALFHFDPLSRYAEVGISFGPEHRGQGYGRETLRLLVDFGFRYRNLRRIWLETLATNEAAIRCYAAVGFVEEGRLREHAWIDGRYVDVLWMGLLRAEWARKSS